MSYTITIPDVPPSLNKLLVLHWRDRHKLKNKWILEVLAARPKRFKPSPMRMRCSITLHHSRFYDKDNAYGAVKVLVDAMKSWRMIVDDSREWLDLSVEQAKCPHKQRHTVIEIGESLA